MKLFIGQNSGMIDFDGPICISNGKKEEIINFLKSKNLLIEELNLNNGQFRKNRVGDQIVFPREWTREEYVFILDIELSDSDVAMKTGRSEISVAMRRNLTYGLFFSYIKKKQLPMLSKEDFKIAVDLFFQEDRDMKQKISEDKNAKKRKIREANNIINVTKSQINFCKANIEKHENGIVDEYMKNEIESGNDKYNDYDDYKVKDIEKHKNKISEYEEYIFELRNDCSF